MISNKQEKFIKRARLVHGGKYNYSKIEYVDVNTKVCIICQIHGEFWQSPHNHLRGYGCPLCGGSNKKTNEEFIKQAKDVHGNKYDYSKVEYINNKTKVCIICPKHGEFWQRPEHHLNGHGCALCYGNKKDTFSSFIGKAEAIHKNRYDYSKIIYNGNKEKVCIICPEHGEFWQTPNDHINGYGCPKCGGKMKSNTNDFIKKSKLIHGDKYDYSNVNYKSCQEKVCIICPEHGEFWQTPLSHLQFHGCPKCSVTYSKTEDDICQLLKQLNPIQHNREILNGKEIDIYIPSLKLGIEYNGIRWHSEQFGKYQNYHIDKLNDCNKQGIRLIQIFEDEWVNHHEICESKLRQICGLNNKPKIFGRKCLIREITNYNAMDFLDKNHIQGFASSTVYLGCYNSDNKLVGVMSFKREHEDGNWDLNRFATDINYKCIGVGGKLFKYFIQHYDYQRIKSFADRRWTTNPYDNLYTKLGFQFVEFTKPDYRYFGHSKCERYHKFGFRKQILHKKHGLPLTMTEYEMTKELGYYRIWDCGLIKYEYTING